MISLAETWKKRYPGAHIGAPAMGSVANPRHQADLEQRKKALESELRTRYTGRTKNDLVALPVMQAYRSYYRQFKKTYHVLLQLRSVALE